MNSYLDSQNRQSSLLSDTPSPINVLYIIHSLTWGGAENQVVTLAPVISSNHYTIKVCCLRNEGPQAKVLREKGIQVVSLNMQLRYWPLAIYKLYRLIKKLKPKIIHTHMSDACFWGTLAGTLAGVPVILKTEHGMPFLSQRYNLVLEHMVGLFTDKIITVSEEIRQYEIQNQKIAPDKIITIPNAVEVEQFSNLDCREQVRNQLGLNPFSILIGTTARLVQPKRLDYFLQSAKLVCDSLPQVRFVIIGDGPLREELENLAKALGLLPEYVKFLGSRHDIPQLLSSMDIFVLSSETEGLPVSLLEAMAASTAVIATRVGGIPQVIQDRKNGLLIPPHDPIGLANAMMTLVKDSTLRISLGIEGYRTVGLNYSTRVIGQEIVFLYDELLQNKET